MTVDWTEFFRSRAPLWTRRGELVVVEHWLGSVRWDWPPKNDSRIFNGRFQ